MTSRPQAPVSQIPEGELIARLPARELLAGSPEAPAPRGPRASTHSHTQPAPGARGAGFPRGPLGSVRKAASQGRRTGLEETQNFLCRQRGRPGVALNHRPAAPPRSRPKPRGRRPLAMGEASREEANTETNTTWELWTSFQTESPQIYLGRPLAKKAFAS